LTSDKVSLVHVNFTTEFDAVQELMFEIKISKKTTVQEDVKNEYKAARRPWSHVSPEGAKMCLRA